MLIRVCLRGNTNRLRELIKKHGQVWNLDDVTNMPCFAGNLGFRITNQTNTHTRNVRKEDIEILDITEYNRVYVAESV